MPSLQPVDASYIATAPRTVVVEQTVAAPPARVWEVVIGNPGWVQWYPTMSSSVTTSDSPTGVGSTRTVKVGGLRAEERFVAWEPEKLWAFTILRTNLPMAKRFLEQLELTAEGDRTKVRYTGAYEPHMLARPFAGAVDKQIRTAWTNGLAGLASYVNR